MKKQFKIIAVIILIGLASTFLYGYHFYEGEMMTQPNESVTLGNTDGPNSMVGDGDSNASIDTRSYGNAPQEVGIAASQRVLSEDEVEKRTATTPQKAKVTPGPIKRL